MNGYNQSPFANLTPVVKNLLIINVIFFIGTYTLGYVGFDMVKWLSAFYFNSPLFHPWQVVSYMFMHAGLAHIFFNMFALFMFGPILEYTMGPKRFLQYYFITGIGALALQMLVQAIEVHGVIGSFTITFHFMENDMPKMIELEKYENYCGNEKMMTKLTKSLFSTEVQNFLKKY